MMSRQVIAVSNPGEAQSAAGHKPLYFVVLNILSIHSTVGLAMKR